MELTDCWKMDSGGLYKWQLDASKLQIWNCSLDYDWFINATGLPFAVVYYGRSRNVKSWLPNECWQFWYSSVTEIRFEGKGLYLSLIIWFFERYDYFVCDYLIHAKKMYRPQFPLGIKWVYLLVICHQKVTLYYHLFSFYSGCTKCDG